MKRDGFVFYSSFLESLDGLSDESYIRLSKCILSLGINGVETELVGVEKNIFATIRPQILANAKRRDNGAKGAESGKLGGRPKKENPIGDIEENPIGVNNNNPIKNINETPNGNGNGNENVNENGNGNCNGENQPPLFLIKTKIKEQGFFFDVDDDQLLERLLAETDPLWFEGCHTFVDFIAQKVQVEYGYKPEGERHRIFRKLLFAAPNLLEAYPGWRLQQEKDDVDRAGKEAVEAARENHPEACGNCGAKLRLYDGMWVCDRCKAHYTFSQAWDYHGPPTQGLSEGFREKKHTGGFNEKENN